MSELPAPPPVPKPQMTSPQMMSTPNMSFRESGAFDSIISVAAFIALDKFLGLPWAIAGATLWSLKATYVKVRKGQRIGWLLPVTRKKGRRDTMPTGAKSTSGSKGSLP